MRDNRSSNLQVVLSVSMLVCVFDSMLDIINGVDKLQGLHEASTTLMIPWTAATCTGHRDWHVTCESAER
jgi:hypothetical protein